MKVLLVVVLAGLGLLSGCTSTTVVHVHAADFSAADQAGIRADLEAEGFSVALRENESPVAGNAILYAFYPGVEKDLQTVENVLAEKGLFAERMYILPTDKKIGTHEYTAGNIGLYLVSGLSKRVQDLPSRVRSEFPLTLTDAEFTTTDCSTKYVYQFDLDRVTVVDLNLPLETSNIATASWHLADDDAVIVTYEQEVFRYRKMQTHQEYLTEHHSYAVRYYLWLEPLEFYRMPFGCTYRSSFWEVF